MTSENAPDPFALHRSLAESEDLDAFLRTLTDRASAALPDVVSASITLRRGGVPVTVASSDGAAEKLDERQYEGSGGPCLSSMRSGREQHVADSAEERRWPEFALAAVELGIRSVMALPLADEDESLGALNLYARPPGVFADRLDTARLLAARATGAVVVAQRIQRHLELAQDVRRAMVSRSVIDQAIGIIMARGRVDADTALEILRRSSQSRNIKLRQICVELVTQTGRRPPSPKDLSPRPERT